MNIVTKDDQGKLLKEIINYYDISMNELRIESMADLNLVLDSINKFNKDKRERLEENI